MAEQVYIDFIEKIINRTKEKKLSWNYLDSKESLYEGMGWIQTRNEYVMFGSNKEVTYPDFDVESSFYATIGNMFVVIYVWSNQPAKLYVVPNTYKKVVSLTPDEYGEYITRLLNLVQSQFPNAETFIKEFTNRGKSDDNE